MCCLRKLSDEMPSVTIYIGDKEQEELILEAKSREYKVTKLIQYIISEWLRRNVKHYPKKCPECESLNLPAAVYCSMCGRKFE